MTTLRPFIPSKNYQKSIDLYTAIGFQMEPVTDDFCKLSYGEISFYLQDFYVQDLANNLMLEICTQDFVKIHHRLLEVLSNEAFEARVGNIIKRPYGEEFNFWDNSGVLWIFRPTVS